MTTVYDVPARLIIEKLAEVLKEYEEIKPPSWANYVKTGSHRERAPDKPAEVWWYIRCASLLRKLYIKGSIGINRLRIIYGGRKNRGSKPYHFRKAGGAIIRNALHQLEDAGLVEVINREGRVLTSKGVSLLDRIAHQIKLNLQKEIPELKNY
ncbi:MAG: 30S ribosomal protein S19e [Candidatus Helarchaeota archaeon]